MNWLKSFPEKLIAVLICCFLYASPVLASDRPAPEGKAAEKEFIPGEFIIDHIKDSYNWHILTKKNGEHVAVYLPVILYSKSSGLNLFMSKKLAHSQSYKGFKISDETGKIVEINDAGETIGSPLDFSITKTVAAMIFAAIVILFLFIRMGSAYKRTINIVPNGFNGFLEPMIVFIRDEIAIPNIGHHKYERFMPYLLTAFFFILVNNIMGLIPFFPFGANVTGNIAVTMVLALITFIITQLSGTKDHWKHVFATPGVPVWLAPIMIPVELIGLFSKPFALMIRLFANITAGHIVVLSLVSLIFIFKALWVSSVSIPMVLFIDILEILVAFLQAYVFTLLSALFIGLAAKEHHHA
jgi:F-type H+-transporting ATPase subunit a